jgi:hypothetical protein
MSRDFRGNIITRQVADEALLRTRGGGGASSAVADGIIFRPGGVAGGNVYTTWASAFAALQSVQGATTLYVDSSLAAAQVPPGTYDGFGAAKLSAYVAGADVLTILDGATLSDWAKFEGLVVACQCLTTNALSFENNFLFVMDDFASIVLDAGATVPALQTFGGGLFSMASRLSVLDNSLAPTVAVIQISANATGRFFVQDAAQHFEFLVTGNEIGGVETSTVAWEADGSTPPLASALFSGANQYDPSDSAPNILYTPAVPGNWAGTAPKTIQQALDRIAANTTNTHPIP